MKIIKFETLIERLTEELISYHNYTVIRPEDGMVIFESPEDSDFGEHTILFNVFACTCDGVTFYIGQLKNLPNERIKILIYEFISAKIDDLLVVISRE